MFAHPYPVFNFALQAERAEAASLLERRLAAIEALLTARRQVAAVAVEKVAEPALPDFMKPPPSVRAGEQEGCRGGYSNSCLCVERLQVPWLPALLLHNTRLPSAATVLPERSLAAQAIPCLPYQPLSACPAAPQVRTSGPAAGNGFEIILQVSCWGQAADLGLGCTRSAAG